MTPGLPHSLAQLTQHPLHASHLLAHSSAISLHHTPTQCMAIKECDSCFELLTHCTLTTLTHSLHDPTTSILYPWYGMEAVEKPKQTMRPSLYCCPTGNPTLSLHTHTCGCVGTVLDYQLHGQQYRAV